MTVTGTTVPSSWRTWVMPIFFPINPLTICHRLLRVFPSECLDFHVDAGRQIEFHQGVNRLRRGFENVEESLVRSNFELLPRLLIHVRRTKNSELVDNCRQWNRAGNTRACPFRSIDNFSGGLIQNPGVVRLEPNSNFFVKHSVQLLSKSYGLGVSMISATVPAPTVRPPSRIANRN